MGRKSREKGKRGERHAAQYLRGLGFEGAYRTQQYAGKTGMASADVTMPEIEGVHIEVKYGYPLSSFDLDKQLFLDAVQQARDDANLGQAWVVLWKPHGFRQWRMTFLWYGFLVTISKDKHIQSALYALDEQSTIDRAENDKA